MTTIAGVAWCPQLDGPMLDQARDMARQFLKQRLTYIADENVMLVEIMSADDARLSALIEQPHAAHMASRLHNDGGVIVLAVEKTELPTEIRCPICTRMLFGDLAARGFCLGCVPQITL